MNIYNNSSDFFQIAIIVAQGVAVIKKRNIDWKNNGNDSNGSLVSTISSSSSRALMCQMEGIKLKLIENIAEQVGTVIQDNITNVIIPYFRKMTNYLLDDNGADGYPMNSDIHESDKKSPDMNKRKAKNNEHDDDWSLSVSKKKKI